MSLSCACNEWDGEGEVYLPDEDLSKLDRGKNRRRCKSCGEPISQGDTVLKFDRGRGIETDIENRIYGDEMVPLAPVYHCEKCGEIYLNLSALGYCMYYDENMNEAIDQYRREHDSGGWFKK